MAKDSSRRNAPTIRTLSYEGLLVGFTDDAWVNATAVARQYGKEPTQWLSQRDTVEYLIELAVAIGKPCRLQEFHEISTLPSESAASRAACLRLAKSTGVARTKAGSPANGGGTWLHPKASVVLARWVNTKFAVWCDMQIDQILRERILAEDLRVSEYLPTYHDLHDKIGLLAAGSRNKHFVHMNMNKLLNKAVGICAGQRERLDLSRRSLMVVAQSVAVSALQGATDHHDGYLAAESALQAFGASINHAAKPNTQKILHK